MPKFSKLLNQGLQSKCVIFRLDEIVPRYSRKRTEISNALNQTPIWSWLWDWVDGVLGQRFKVFFICEPVYNKHQLICRKNDQTGSKDLWHLTPVNTYPFLFENGDFFFRKRLRPHVVFFNRFCPSTRKRNSDLKRCHFLWKHVHLLASETAR